MNNLLIFIVLTIFLIIFVAKVYIVNIEQLEHLTQQSDEAIQNLASLYNKDKLTIGNLNVTTDGNINQLETKDITAETTSTDKLKLGDKWLLSGVGDAHGNDEWLRIMKGDGSKAYYGGVAANKIYSAEAGGTMKDLYNKLKSHIDKQISAYRTPYCNWSGWRTFCGNCSDKKDDFNLHCTGGRLTHFNVQDTRPFYRP